MFSRLVWHASRFTVHDALSFDESHNTLRYNTEISEQVAAGVMPPVKKDEIAPHETAIPIARVKKTCKLDPEVKNLSKEATAIIAKATELFTAMMAEESFKISALSGRRTLKTEDIRDCVNRLDQFEWLRDDFPYDMDLGATSSSSKTSQLEVHLHVGFAFGE